MKYLILLIAIGWTECALRDKAKSIYVGTAVTVEELGDSQEYQLAGQQFNMLTCGNEMKWEDTEAIQGKKTYEAADKIVAYAQQHSMRMRGHTLVWHQQLPAWVKTLNKTALRSAMESRIKDIVGHYKGKIYGWDVVNEVISDKRGQVLKDTLWSQNLGESFITEAFKLTHQIDPSTKLYINDYGVETVNVKSNTLYNFVKKLKSEGVPLHGVGFQGHWVLGENLSSFQANLQRFVDLGVEVAVTEADFRIRLPSSNVSLQQQAKDYAHVYASCIAVKNCAGITIWGFTDKHSWIPSWTPGFGDALIYDKNYKPKPAYYAIEKVLK